MLAQLVGDASIAEDLAQEAYAKAVTAKVSGGSLLSKRVRTAP